MPILCTSIFWQPILCTSIFWQLILLTCLSILFTTIWCPFDIMSILCFDFDILSILYFLFNIVSIFRWGHYNICIGRKQLPKCYWWLNSNWRQMIPLDIYCQLRDWTGINSSWAPPCSIKRVFKWTPSRAVRTVFLSCAADSEWRITNRRPDSHAREF